MTISYNWLSDYLPEKIAPEKLAEILTSLGLEVENFEQTEEIKGSLQGLVIGKVLTVEKHPNADKLHVTRVDVGSDQPLQIVCGAPNVAESQTVVVAPVGTKLYPVSQDPFRIKPAKIRGTESQGMICAEDEVGLGMNHDGIMVLPDSVVAGTPAADYFRPQSDWIYEIGLTPNRMDAMSHLGVAKDICAYLSVHENKDLQVRYPYKKDFSTDSTEASFHLVIENPKACERYSGVVIENVTIHESPQWLKRRIKSVGLRPINNIVDITNFILHETGQPLHAFDANKIKGNSIRIKNLSEGTAFVTLDEKERKLHADDLMICDGDNEPMCFGGVFGGLHSGVTEQTQTIFLESAWFNPVYIRKTAFRHNLRTDAAARFEKGTDIGNVVTVLKRAALLIKELAGGRIASEIMDVYPEPRKRKRVVLKYSYLKKLSGKDYPAEDVKKVLLQLGFGIVQDDQEQIQVEVPYSKFDIELPADIVEEIMRVDGYDNVVIPGSITISPAVERTHFKEALKEKIAGFLSGNGFHEIVTNSITNSSYFTEDVLQHSVKMLNSLSADLNIMRPSMLESGLECISHNLNRKNNNLRLFEFGKTYHVDGVGQYREDEKLCLYIAGKLADASWKTKEINSDFYFLKGMAESILKSAGFNQYQTRKVHWASLSYGVEMGVNGDVLIRLGQTAGEILQKFDIKQSVWFAEIDWERVVSYSSGFRTGYTEIPRFPAVQRDLSIVVDKGLTYESVEDSLNNLQIKKLKDVQLFDVFESDKLGEGKKSFAVSLTFQDSEKTLTDTEIDGVMQKIIRTFEKELSAVIRK